MLSALLPGVREFRTPLVTGFLWAACLWVAVGFRLADSDSTNTFVRRFHLDDLPSAFWLGGGALLVYLVGSLLVVRTSPLGLVSDACQPRLQPIVARLDEDREPKCWRHRMLWKAWRSYRLHLASNAIRAWIENGQRAQPVDGWLYNEFQSLASDGRVPVMRSYERCVGPNGFHAFYSTDSLDAYASSTDDSDIQNSLAASFVYEVKGEEEAVEVRIQMRFPEVYAEIDRLKVEAELRLSIFWPLIILSALLAWAWSPLALLLLLVPPFLLRDGFQRMRQASDKTWGALMAREVTSPILDAMEQAKDEQCRDFQNRFGGTSELKVVEDAG